MELKVLLERCLKNDKKAQRALVEMYGRKIMAISKRYRTRNVDENDIFQDAMVKVFKSLKQFDLENGNFDGWVYRITVNEALGLIRKNTKYDHVQDVNEIVETENMKVQFNDEVSFQDLLKLIERLPEMQKLVFNLYAVEGFQHDEIGERLGINAVTSRSQYSRAKMKLREMYEQENL